LAQPNGFARAPRAFPAVVTEYVQPGLRSARTCRLARAGEEQA